MGKIPPSTRFFSPGCWNTVSLPGTKRHGINPVAKLCCKENITQQTGLEKQLRPRLLTRRGIYSARGLANTAEGRRRLGPVQTEVPEQRARLS